MPFKKGGKHKQDGEMETWRLAEGTSVKSAQRRTDVVPPQVKLVNGSLHCGGGSEAVAKGSEPRKGQTPTSFSPSGDSCPALSVWDSGEMKAENANRCAEQRRSRGLQDRVGLGRWWGGPFE